MKTITLSIVLLLASVFSNAQPTGACGFISISTQYVSSSPSLKYPGKCDVKVNLSWELNVNNGNKYCYVHIWPSNAYRAFTYTNPANPPQAADLSATAGTVIVKDPSSTTPTLYSTYNPDKDYEKVLPLAGYPSATLRKTTLNGVDRFTVENLVLPGIDCNANGIYNFTTDGWASQQAQGKNVHCVSSGNQFSINQIVDRSSISCVSNTLQFQLQSNAPQANGTYKVYADLGADATFEPSADAVIAAQNFTTGTTALVNGTWSYVFQSNIPIPAAYKHNNYWIEVVPSGSKGQQIFQVANGCAPLPENLAYFTATRIKNNVSLKWETVNEQVTKGFAVQRKTDAGWEQVAFVPTNAPGGNSSSLIAYQFNDLNSFKGVSQYQVVEITANGKQKASEIRAVKGESQSSRVTVYPNPSNSGTVNIVFENNAMRDVVLSDMTGRVVKQFNATSDANIIVENLHDGFYTVRITDRSTNETVTQKVIVNKR